ncbi:hypothetical protein [Thermoactinospora rubra]|uniref:hypothetical protein n=1 Tax=Thermoactinospora rubra TaxID=1088767 RepID=UPI00117FAC57|nr:hypothetical protein [Thermoactinospora rubra]
MTSLTKRPAHRPGRTPPGMRLPRRRRIAIDSDHASGEEIAERRDVHAFLESRPGGEGAAT